MTFRWLPDSELYAHPRFSWAIQCAFDIVVNALYRKEILVPDRLQLPAGTLIVCNHRCDSDAPILASTLCWRQGLRLHGRLPFFAMREDLFQRHALANLLSNKPAWMARTLGLIPLGWLFRNVRVRPIRRLPEFTLGETVQALQNRHGRVAPTDCFNAHGLRELRAQLGDLPAQVESIDPWRLGPLRLQRWGLRRLRLTTLRELAPEFRHTIAAQLQECRALLDAGHLLYFAYEGHISMDGHFGRVRGGLRQLCERALSAPPVPFALSYDALGPGRKRVVIRMGEPLRGLDPSDPRTFTENLHRAMVQLHSVTISHLLAHYLCAGPKRFSTHECAEWLQHCVDLMRTAGISFDPLLTRMPVVALVERRLRWLRRKKLLVKNNELWSNQWPEDAPAGWSTPARKVRYFANALSDLAPGLIRDLAP